MATRRKYLTRSNDPGSDPAPAADVPAMAAQAPLAAPEPAAVPDDPNPLQAAHDAQQHAEALQRQHAQRQQIGLSEPDIDPQQRQAVDAHIDSMGLTAHQARFLKSHPSLLHEPYLSLMRHAVMIARHANIPENSSEFDSAILAGVARDLEHHAALTALTSASARPTPENHQMHHDVGEAAAELQREAESYIPAQQPAEPPPQPRRSIPMSAPVSRDVSRRARPRHRRLDRESDDADHPCRRRDRISIRIA